MNNIGINQIKTQDANRSLVIRLLQSQGSCSRAELSRLSHLTQATITNIVADLISSDLVEEIGFGSTAGQGRRSILLRLKGDNYHILAVKIARTSYSVGIFNLLGKELESATMPVVNGESPNEIMLKIKAISDGYFGKYNNILACGVAVPGPYLNTTGKITINTSSVEWSSICIPSSFSELYHIPVFVEQDANAGAMADWWFEDFSHKTDCLCHLLLGEGIGVGVVENGELIHGRQGATGALGHLSVDVNGPKCICGNRGCLELYCSALALRQGVVGKLNDYPKCALHGFDSFSYPDIFIAADEGDELATMEVENCAKYIGYAIVNIVNAYNPDVIVLSDIMALGGDRLLSIACQTAKERCIPELFNDVTICFSKGKSDSVLAGAAAIATNQVFLAPGEYIIK